ncbi:ribulose-phosphate 3-epimerase [Aureococcus anophagefferens]|nr:ribulose-phosphate 3-epimerase [Aureococcus anophagefferens]
MAVYDGDDDRRPFLSSPSKARHGSRDANKADADADATREAFFISVISVLCTSVSSLVGLGLFFNAGSTAMLGFALVNIVDTIGSLLMLWRFEGGGDAVPHAVLEARGSLTVAERTDSDALYMDGVCSLNGALLSFSAAAAAILFVRARFWWSDLVDPARGALWLIFYGAAVLSRFKRRRWWSPAFWAVEADDGARADRGRAGEFYPARARRLRRPQDGAPPRGAWS